MPSLISELKRRNVFRVGTAYVLLAWLVAQAGDLVADNLPFPAWFMQMLLAVLALGLPVALFFAWAFELTPDGVKKTEEVDRDASITPSTERRLNHFIIAALTLTVLLLLGDRFREPAEPTVAADDGVEMVASLQLFKQRRRDMTVLRQARHKVYGKRCVPVVTPGQQIRRLFGSDAGLARTSLK